MIFTDLAWGIYVKTLAKDKIYTAGVFSMLIMLFGATVTINYIGDHAMLLPAAAGAFVGTVLTKRVEGYIEKIFKKKNNTDLSPRETGEEVRDTSA